MINMKNIFKSLLMVLSGAMLFASCQEEAAPLASAISVDKQELTFAGASAEAQKVKVKAEGEWFVLSSEEWVTVKPAYGNGDTDVTITVADNVDSYNELEGPRSTVVNFCYGTTGVTPVAVKQLGENGLDASRTYSLVTKQEDIVAGSYLIVFNNAGKHIAMEPLTPSKAYGYLNAVDVTPEDGVITMSNGAYAFSLEAAETGYNMIMSDNRYIFMTGGYNSFNVSASKADANPWTFTLNEDGTVNIAAVTHNNYIQYSTVYSSAGAYTSPQDGGLLPYLYKDSKAKSDEVLSVKDVTVPSFATEVKIKVTSNKKWSVRNHDSWIKSFTTSGENDGEIVVTFDAYTSTTEARTAQFQVIGETTNMWITLTQSKVAPEMTVAEFLAIEKGEYAILKGSIENIKNSTYGNFDLQDATGTVYIYGLYDVNGAKVFTDLGLKEGDVVTLYGVKDVYKENPQLANGVYISHVSSKIRRKLAFSAESAEATLGNAFTAPSLSGETVGVVYSSSKPEVATVNAETGEVTLVAVGNTTITATGPETETHLAGTASYALTVSSKLTRALKFSAATASATLGEAFTAPTLSGVTEGVVYSSSNTAVATVDAATGTVTLVAAGETTITASAEETETLQAGTASYTLTVSEAAVTPEGPLVVTVAEFNAAANDETIEYQVSGTISGIYQAYNSQFKNISLYISDETGEMLAFRLTCEGITDPATTLTEGDLITVRGYRTIYNTKPQMAQGCVIVSHTDVVVEEPETPESAVVWTMGSGNQTWAADTHQTYGSGYAATVDGVKVAYYQYNNSNAARTPDSDHIRVYKESALVISAEGKSIKSVTIETTTTEYTSAITVGGNTVSPDGKTITWNGNVNSFEAITAGQIRIKKLTIVAE